MVGRISLRLVIFGGLAALFAPALLAAQIPARLKRCLPYPTLAEEVSQTISQNREEPGAAARSVVVDSVKLVGGASLPDDVRRKLVASVPHAGGFSPDWLREVEEVGARGALQDAGYFKASVEAAAQTRSTDSASQHVAISLRIEEGARYRLRSVQFRSISESTSLLFSFERSGSRYQCLMEPSLTFPKSGLAPILWRGCIERSGTSIPLSSRRWRLTTKLAP